MYRVDRTVLVAIACDSCGATWTDPWGGEGEHIYSVESAAIEPWRNEAAAAGWRLTDGWKLTDNITATHVLCPECAAGCLPEQVCPNCQHVITRTNPGGAK